MFEDLKKKQRGGAAPAPGPGLSIPFTRVGNPKVRVLVLLAVAAILGGGVIMIRGFASNPEARRMKHDVPAVEIERETLPSGVPTLDHTYAKAIADDTAKERGRWEEEAIAYLLTEARGTPAVYAYSRNLLPVHPDSAAEIEKDAAPWRFQFVRFRGRVEYMRETDYADLHGGDESIGQVHIGRVVAAPGEPPLRVVFVTPNVPLYKDQNDPDPIPAQRMIKDGWVRGRGIFVKRYLDVGPDGREVPALLVVVMKLERDFAPVTVASLSDIPFEIIDDDPAELAQTDRGMNMLFKTYPRPLFRLLQYATPRAGDAGKALREKEALEKLSIHDPPVYEEVVAQPARNRAKYYGGFGATAMDALYVGPDDISDDDVNDAGIREYVTGWLVTDRERLFKFVAPAHVAKDFKEKTRIRWEGYFYKTQAYYARDGATRLVPFFVLTVLEQVHPPPADHTFQIVIAASFILGICVLAFIIVREDKTKQSYRSQFRTRASTG